MDFPVLDKCPGYNLYIGGFIALRRPRALQNCNITHIVSVLDWKFDGDDSLTRGYEHLHIPVDDVEDENLLVWFPRSNAFIHHALASASLTKSPPDAEASASNPSVPDANSGNAVLVHCAMGKSRSATVLIAYLLWRSRQPSATPPRNDRNDKSAASIPDQPLSVADALMLLRQGRPIAEPNEGFMDQLHLFVDMGCPTTQAQLENHRIYKRWMNKRNVEESLRINRAPDMVDIQFEDEDSPFESEASMAAQTASLSLTSDSPSSATLRGSAGDAASSAEPDVVIKCRRCRHLLARSAFTVTHSALKSDPSAYSADGDADSARGACAHIFLHPLSWMRESLSDGQLEGRLTCPNKKCGQNVGKFAWQGLRCSCGKWITPAFALGRARIDETSLRPSEPEPGAGGGGGGGGGSAGLRLPPSMRSAGKGKI